MKNVKIYIVTRILKTLLVRESVPQICWDSVLDSNQVSYFVVEYSVGEEMSIVHRYAWQAFVRRLAPTYKSQNHCSSRGSGSSGGKPEEKIERKSGKYTNRNKQVAAHGRTDNLAVTPPRVFYPFRYILSFHPQPALLGVRVALLLPNTC